MVVPFFYLTRGIVNSSTSVTWKEIRKPSSALEDSSLLMELELLPAYPMKDSTHSSVQNGLAKPSTILVVVIPTPVVANTGNVLLSTNSPRKSALPEKAMTVSVNNVDFHLQLPASTTNIALTISDHPTSMTAVTLHQTIPAYTKVRDGHSTVSAQLVHLSMLVLALALSSTPDVLPQDSAPKFF